jgi:hypothetical protein
VRSAPKNPFQLGATLWCLRHRRRATWQQAQIITTLSQSFAGSPEPHLCSGGEATKGFAPGCGAHLLDRFRPVHASADRRSQQRFIARRLPDPKNSCERISWVRPLKKALCAQTFPPL